MFSFKEKNTALVVEGLNFNNHSLTIHIENKGQDST
jgi:hypothetical protein